MAESLEILLQILEVEVGRNAPAAEDLAKLPERQTGKLVGLAHREAPLLVEMDCELDPKLFHGQTSRVENVEDAGHRGGPRTTPAGGCFRLAVAGMISPIIGPTTHPPHMMKLALQPAIHLFLVVFGLYLVWSGHWHDPLLVGLGVASAAGVVFLCHRMGIVDRDLLPLDLYLGWVGYLPWLAREVVASNLGVIRRVLDPARPIDPRVIHVEASQESEIGRVTYANSITLTPGTLTLDLDRDRLTVHAIAAETAEWLEGGEMDRRTRRMEERGR